jgi:hypothetical protein
MAKKAKPARKHVEIPEAPKSRAIARATLNRAALHERGRSLKRELERRKKERERIERERIDSLVKERHERIQKEKKEKERKERDEKDRLEMNQLYFERETEGRKKLERDFERERQWNFSAEKSAREEDKETIARTEKFASDRFEMMQRKKKEKEKKEKEEQELLAERDKRWELDAEREIEKQQKEFREHADAKSEARRETAEKKSRASYIDREMQYKYQQKARPPGLRYSNHRAVDADEEDAWLEKNIPYIYQDRMERRKKRDEDEEAMLNVIKEFEEDIADDDLPPPRIVHADYRGDSEMEDEWIEEHLAELEEEQEKAEEFLTRGNIKLPITESKQMQHNLELHRDYMKAIAKNKTDKILLTQLAERTGHSRKLLRKMYEQKDSEDKERMKQKAVTILEHENREYIKSYARERQRKLEARNALLTERRQQVGQVEVATSSNVQDKKEYEENIIWLNEELAKLKKKDKEKTPPLREDVKSRTILPDENPRFVEQKKDTDKKRKALLSDSRTRERQNEPLFIEMTDAQLPEPESGYAEEIEDIIMDSPPQQQISPRTLAEQKKKYRTYEAIMEFKKGIEEQRKRKNERARLLDQTIMEEERKLEEQKKKERDKQELIKKRRGVDVEITDAQLPSDSSEDEMIEMTQNRSPPPTPPQPPQNDSDDSDSDATQMDPPNPPNPPNPPGDDDYPSDIDDDWAEGEHKIARENYEKMQKKINDIIKNLMGDLNQNQVETRSLLSDGTYPDMTKWIAFIDKRIGEWWNHPKTKINKELLQRFLRRRDAQRGVFHTQDELNRYEGSNRHLGNPNRDDTKYILRRPGDTYLNRDLQWHVAKRIVGYYGPRNTRGNEGIFIQAQEFDPERERWVLRHRMLRARQNSGMDDDPRNVFTPHTWNTIIPDFAHIRRDALVVTNPVTDVDADEVLAKSQDKAYHPRHIPPDPTTTGVYLTRDQENTGKSRLDLRREAKYGEGKIIYGLKNEPVESQPVVQPEIPAAIVPTTTEQHPHFEWKEFDVEAQFNQLVSLSNNGEKLQDIFEFLISRAQIIRQIRYVVGIGGPDGNATAAYNEARSMLQYLDGMLDDYNKKFKAEERWTAFDKTKETYQTDFWVKFLNELYSGERDSLEFILDVPWEGGDKDGSFFDLTYHIQQVYDANAVKLIEEEDHPEEPENAPEEPENAPEAPEEIPQQQPLLERIDIPDIIPHSDDQRIITEDRRRRRKGKERIIPSPYPVTQQQPSTSSPPIARRTRGYEEREYESNEYYKFFLQQIKELLLSNRPSDVKRLIMAHIQKKANSILSTAYHRDEINLFVRNFNKQQQQEEDEEDIEMKEIEIQQQQQSVDTESPTPIYNNPATSSFQDVDHVSDHVSDDDRDFLRYSETTDPGVSRESHSQREPVIWKQNSQGDELMLEDDDVVPSVHHSRFKRGGGRGHHVDFEVDDDDDNIPPHHAPAPLTPVIHTQDVRMGTGPPAANIGSTYTAGDTPNTELRRLTGTGPGGGGGGGGGGGVLPQMIIMGGRAIVPAALNRYLPRYIPTNPAPVLDEPNQDRPENRYTARNVPNPALARLAGVFSPMRDALQRIPGRVNASNFRSLSSRMGMGGDSRTIPFKFM